MHFDRPAVRRLAGAHGRWGEWDWRFPEGDCATCMRLYIGMTVTDVEYRHGEYAVLHIAPSVGSFPSVTCRATVPRRSMYRAATQMALTTGEDLRRVGGRSPRPRPPRCS